MLEINEVEITIEEMETNKRLLASRLIRLMRKYRGITQDRMAAMAGISKYQLTCVELIPSATESVVEVGDLHQKLCNAINVSYDAFLNALNTLCVKCSSYVLYKEELWAADFEVGKYYRQSSNHSLFGR